MSEAVIIAGISALASIVVAVLQIKQKVTLDKLANDQQKTKTVDEAKDRLMVLEREKNDKLEAAIITILTLTGEMARHIIDGNHIDRLRDEYEKISLSATDLMNARNKLQEGYRDFEISISKIHK